jgi:hypothetical protein
MKQCASWVTGYVEAFLNLFSCITASLQWCLHCFQIPLPEQRFICSPNPIKSRDYAVGISTGHGLDGRGYGVRPVGARFLSTSSRQVLGPTQPPIYWVPAALSQGMDPYIHLPIFLHCVALTCTFTFTLTQSHETHICHITLQRIALGAETDDIIILVRNKGTA